MHINASAEKPIFLQVSEAIEEAIFTGAFPEETQIPSTTEFSTNYKINPATVLKGMNLLVEQNLIYKKRGLGMFVQTGAQKKVMEKRRLSFYNTTVGTFLQEAKLLSISLEELLSLIERGYRDEGN